MRRPARFAIRQAELHGNSCSARSVEGSALKGSGTCASSLPQRVDGFLPFFWGTAS